MYCKKLVYSMLFVFLIFIIFSIDVYAVGIGSYGSPKEILFQPDTEYAFKYYLFDSPLIHAALEGDLAQYATLIDSDPEGVSRNVEIRFKTPSYLEPGEHTLYLVATEARVNAAPIGGIASVRNGLNIFALYPDKHPIFDRIEVNDVNVNEKTTLGLTVTNQGEEDIADVNGIITIYDSNNQTIAILRTDSKSVASYTSKTVNTVLDAALYNMTPGRYKVTGKVTYDGIAIDEVKEGYIIVGQLQVNILDSTKDLIVNATNKYYLTLESDWSGDITDVYAKIKTPSGKVIKTQNIDLIKPGPGRKAAGVIEAYIETDGLSIGEHSFDVTLFYKGSSITDTIKVNVIDGKPPIIDKPSIINSKVVFIGISAVIVIFIAVYFFVFRRMGKKSSPQISSNDNNIRPPTL